METLVSSGDMALLSPPSPALRACGLRSSGSLAFTNRYLPFALAVTLAALFGGREPGMAANALSALAVAWFFLEPSLAFADPAAAWALGLFVVAATPVALLVGSLQEALVARARTEQELRRDAKLIDLSHDAVITMDCERRITTWNKGAEEMFGWSEQDVAVKVLHQLLQTVGDISMTEIDEILHREGRWEGERRRTARDGRRLVVDRRQVLIRGENGLPARILAISRDITEHRRAEEALRESEAQFRTLADAIPQLCWTANADGGVSWFNQRSYEYTGTTPEQMEGWGWQSVLDPKVLPKVLERWRHSIATGEPFEMVFPLRGADGVFRDFLSRGMPVRDREGKVTRWFGTNTDISEKRRTENALRESEERLRLAQQVARLGTFEWDLQTRVDRWTPELEALYGLPPGGFAGTKRLGRNWFTLQTGPRPSVVCSMPWTPAPPTMKSSA
jgi:PAS domain S-box-containing protein